MHSKGAPRAYTVLVHANKFKLWTASLSLCMLATPAALSAAAPPAAAGTAGDITVSEARSPPTPPGSAVGAVYLRIANRGSRADQLLGVETPVAATAGLHETRVVDGLRQMRAVETLDCPPGGIVKIEAGGLHIMLGGLRSPLTPGMHFPLLLRFRHAGDLRVDVPVT